jgi:hypothetical protein
MTRCILFLPKRSIRLFMPTSWAKLNRSLPPKLYNLRQGISNSEMPRNPNINVSPMIKFTDVITPFPVGPSRFSLVQPIPIYSPGFFRAWRWRQHAPLKSVCKRDYTSQHPRKPSSSDTSPVLECSSTSLCFLTTNISQLFEETMGYNDTITKFPVVSESGFL